VDGDARRAPARTARCCRRTAFLCVPGRSGACDPGGGRPAGGNPPPRLQLRRTRPDKMDASTALGGGRIRQTRSSRRRTHWARAGGCVSLLCCRQCWQCVRHPSLTVSMACHGGVGIIFLCISLLVSMLVSRAGLLDQMRRSTRNAAPDLATSHIPDYRRRPQFLPYDRTIRLRETWTPTATRPMSLVSCMCGMHAAHEET